MTSIEATAVARHWLDLLVNDETIKSWALSKYGRAPTFYLGVNVKDPPSAKNCPVVALYPLPESGGQEIYPWTHAVGIEWAVYQEGTQLIRGITECLGLVEADELGQLILGVLQSDSEFISNQIDYSVNPVEHWPIFQGDASIVARPAPDGGVFLMGIEGARVAPVTAETAHAISYGDSVTLHQVDQFNWSVATLERLSEADAGTIAADPLIHTVEWSLSLGAFDGAMFDAMLGGSEIAGADSLPAFKLEVDALTSAGETATVTVDKATVTGFSAPLGRGSYSALTVTGTGVMRRHDRRVISFSGI